MGNNFYQYHEIMFGLRDEYIKNQMLLDELKKYIKVEGENIGDVSVFSQLSSSLLRINIPKIRVVICKRQSEILKKMNYLMYGLHGDFKGSSHFRIEKIGTSYGLVGDNISPVPYIETFHPEVKITDQEAFDDISHQILSSSFMALPEVYEKLNSFQALNISGSETYLYNSFALINSRDSASICYIPESDSVYVDLGKGGCTYMADKLLEEKIPKCVIPDVYRTIIDSNERSKRRAWVEGILDGRKTELSINEVNGRFVLAKKKQRRQHL